MDTFFLTMKEVGNMRDETNNLHQEALQEVVRLTEEIEEVEKHLSALRSNRNRLIVGLRRNKVTARKISDALGISEQSIHKIVKGYK